MTSKEKCIAKLTNYLEENKLSDNNLITLFENTDLENLPAELAKLEQTEIVKKAVDIVCEELLISAAYKIERSGMKLGLHRMEKILELLGNPEKNMRVIHIAGTNGKGSTSSFIKDVLKTKYRVGFYSSPGMLSFNDRIRVNDDFIPYKRAYDLYNLVINTWYENNPHSDDNLSFFEIITALALVYFSEQNCDFVIMEVGLGGRYDGTNIFKNKELSIITKIGLDHTAILGDSLEKIAYEKAGIIQENDNVIIYPANDGVKKVIADICSEKNAKLEIVDFNNISNKKSYAHGNEFDYLDFKNIKIKMVGEHQIYNCSLALSAIFNLRNRNIIAISDKEIKNSLATSTWAGRLEWLKENILIDGAHNKDGIESLVNYIKTQNFPKLKILLGILEDKDYKDMVAMLKTINADFYATKVPIEIKESNLDNLANSFGNTKVTKFDNYNIAVDTFLKELKNDETLLITGSLYLISAVREKIVGNLH